MRKCLALLILTFACAHPSTAQTQTDRESAGVIGPVRTVRVETARVSDVSGQLVEGERAVAQIFSFDMKGGLTERSVFNRGGSPDRKRRSYTYDAKGRESERAFLNADGVLTSKAVSTYDVKGRKVEMTFYNPGGEVNHVEKFEYDDRGKMIREVHLNPDGTIRNASAYTHDASGRLIEWSLYKPDGSLSQRRVSTYDEKGRETGWTIYRGEGTPALGQRRSYNERGNVVESLRYGNGVLVSRETFTYEFDERGNWVRRRTLSETVKGGISHTEIQVDYRTITYY